MSRKTVMWIALATLLVGTVSFLVTIRVSRAGTLVKTDGLAYFLYARSAVIDFDTDITNEYDTLDARIPEGYDNMMVALRKHARRHPETQRIVVPWPVGSGLVMVPFYAVGWGAEVVVAKASGREPDSYGLIPQFFYGTGSLAYAVLGFWAMVHCCRRIARNRESWLAPLVLIFAGSPAFYIFISPSMSHSASLGLSSLLVLLWWRRWDGESDDIVWPALVLGIMMTVRYQNTMFFPLLVALVLRKAVRESVVSAAKTAALGVGALLIPVAVQVLHYFRQHGFGSRYGVGVGSSSFKLEQNEVSVISWGFFDVLFSCLHGLIYWTPVVAFAIAGLVWALKKEGWARIFLLTFCTHVYLIGALADGTAGHAFGMRYLIETTPMLAVGLAWLLTRTAEKVPMAAWLGVFGFFAAINAALAMAFGMGTISGTHCVTHAEMLQGVMEALGRLTGSSSG